MTCSSGSSAPTTAWRRARPHRRRLRRPPGRSRCHGRQQPLRDPRRTRPAAGSPPRALDHPRHVRCLPDDRRAPSTARHRRERTDSRPHRHARRGEMARPGGEIVGRAEARAHRTRCARGPRSIPRTLRNAGEIGSLAMTMDRLLTAEELAERLRVNTEWVWAQARAGRIPHVRLGRYRRFRESAIEAWLSELETGGAGSSAARPVRPVPLRRRA